MGIERMVLWISKGWWNREVKVSWSGGTNFWWRLCGWLYVQVDLPFCGEFSTLRTEDWVAVDHVAKDLCYILFLIESTESIFQVFQRFFLAFWSAQLNFDVFKGSFHQEHWRVYMYLRHRFIVEFWQRYFLSRSGRNMSLNKAWEVLCKGESSHF